MSDKVNEVIGGGLKAPTHGKIGSCENNSDIDDIIALPKLTEKDVVKKSLLQTKLQLDRSVTGKTFLSTDEIDISPNQTVKKWTKDLLPYFEFVAAQSNDKLQEKLTMKCNLCFKNSGKVKLVSDKSSWSFKRHLQVSLCVFESK